MATSDAPSQPICPLDVSERTLSALRDHALDRSEDARVSAHVETCPACAVRLSSFNELAALVRSERPPEPDERLWRAVAATAPSSGRGHGARFARVALSRQSWSRLGAIAAVLLLTLGFLTVSSLHHSGVSVRLTATTTRNSTPTSTPAATATTDLLPARPLSWQPAGAPPGHVIAFADDGKSAYACSIGSDAQGNGVLNIWRTSDRGASWAPAQTEPSTPTVNGCELVVDVSDPSVAALAWAPRGGGAGDSYTNLMTTVDGGTTWQAQPTQPFSRIDQLDSRGGVIYALRETANSAGSVDYHLWASRDRMASWRQIDAGQTLSAAVAGFWFQTDGQGILAVVSGGANAVPTQLFFSPDDGASWHLITVPGGVPVYINARFTSGGAGPNSIVARFIGGEIDACIWNQPVGNPYQNAYTVQVTCSHDSGKTWHTWSVTLTSTVVPVDGPNLVAMTANGDLLVSGLGNLYRLDASGLSQSLGALPQPNITYCSAPGAGILWAVPAGAITDHGSRLFTANYAL